MVLSMDNFSIIKTAALEINALDTCDVVKVAGILDNLKNLWKRMWNTGYSTRYNKIRGQYSVIELELQELKNTIQEIDESISESDVGKYDVSVRKLKRVLDKLNQKINNLQQSAEGIQAPEEIVDRYNRTQYDDPQFLENFKRRFRAPDPRINITRSDAEQVKFNSVEFFNDVSKDDFFWRNTATFAASSKIIKTLNGFIPNFNPNRFRSAFKMLGDKAVITDQTREAINKAIIENGIICHYYPKEPAPETSEDPRRLREIFFGQMEMGIKVEFTLPNTFYKFQAYIYTTDLKSSQRSAHKISIGKFETVRMLSPHLSSMAGNNNNKHINKFAEIKNESDSILAVKGIQKTSPAFRKKLLQIATDLSTNVDWLAAVISLESGFSPSVANFGNPERGAVGLIQFMPNTAAHLLGISDSQEARKRMQAMGDLEQLDYVRKFYAPFKGRLNSPEDVYMAVFWPIGVGKSSDFIIAKEGSPVYRENKVFDREKTGVITKRQVGGAIKGAIESAKGKRISVNDDSIKEITNKDELKKEKLNKEDLKEDRENKNDFFISEIDSDEKIKLLSEKLKEEIETTDKLDEKSNSQIRLVDIANFGRLESIIRTAIEERALEKQSFNIFANECSIQQINKLSDNLKILINVKSEIYTDKNNNYRLKCMAHGPEESLYKAVSSICNYHKINFKIG